ncbi:putative ribonuclease H-like domain-containing protein [Tanacetum coccineum]|uniref:Ribonuclease H-like domain-containing protein n=1 Tax=Tanacetum coccineum TaxID=301880 RepID=A0ABQ5HXB2_9ASTR
MVEGNGPKWLFDIDSLTQSMNYVPVVTGTTTNESASTREDLNADASYFKTASMNDNHDAPESSSAANNMNDDKKDDEYVEPQPSRDPGKKIAEGVSNASRVEYEDRPESSTPTINIAEPNINTAGPSVNTTNYDSPEPSNAYLIGDDTELDMSNLNVSYQVPTTPTTRIHKDHSLNQVIGDIQAGVQTRGMTKTADEQALLSAAYERKPHEDLNTCMFFCFLSQEEPKRVAKALSDSSWVEAMQEELLQIKLQKVWVLVDLPNGKRAIGTKWIFRNKKDERGIVIRNKAKLVALGHTQEEGIDYDDVFSPVARIEAIRLFLAYASFMGITVYQIDVKSAFLYGQIDEEVYVCQPPGFKDPDHPDKVYKVAKAMYGLHQAPRAWYATLANYLMGNGFQRGKIDQTLFIKRQKGDILLVQIYVDDIIFGSTKMEMCTKFEKFMKDKFQMTEILRKFNYTDVKSASTTMDLEKPLVKDGDADDVDVHLYRSMIGSLMYLTSSRPDIMFAVCACLSFQVTPKTSHLLDVKRIFRYLKGKPTLGLWYPRDSPFELVAYSDSDYARATQDRKSTTGGSAASCCGQVMWIQNQLLDYRYNFMNTMIHIDNNSTICIIENPVEHCKTKHIEIRHHFIRDCNAKKLIQMVKIHTDNNVADLLTKGFDAGRTAKLCTIQDGVMAIKTTIDRKVKVTVSEASIRRHLKLEDVDGISSLPNEEIFEHLARMGTFNFSKYIFDAMVKNLDSTHKFLIYPRRATKGYSGVITPLFDTMLVPPQGEAPSTSPSRISSSLSLPSYHTTSSTPTTPPSTQYPHEVEEPTTMPHDSPILGGHTPGSDEGRIQHDDLTDLLTKLTDMIEALEQDLCGYCKSLKKTVKTGQTRTREWKSTQRAMRMLSKVNSSQPSEEVEKTSADTKILVEEEEPTRIIEDLGSADKGEKEISTANMPVSTASPPKVTTANVSTAAASLVYIRRSASKAKDKGKAIMTEPEPSKKLKKRVQVQLSVDEELARKIKEEEQARAMAEQEQERLNLEAALEIQRQLDERQEVPAEPTQTHDIDWNDPSVLRYHALQNRPYYVAEVRRNMIMYLKNQAGYKQSYFKGMKYEEIRPIFEKVWDQVNTFVPIGSEIEKETSKPVEEERVQEEDVKPEQIVKESSKKSGRRRKSLARKRARETQSEETSKKQKHEDDAKKEELRLSLKIVSDKDKDIDYEVLDMKYPIVDWESQVLGNLGEMEMHVYKITRADGNSKFYSNLSRMLDTFDREDVLKLHSLVMERFPKNDPDGYDLLLWGDLKVLIDPQEDDDI